jgi:hypothetical protein
MEEAVRPKPARPSIPVGVEVLLVFVAGLGASFVHSVACLAVLALGSLLLVHRHKDHPATVVGILFSIACMTPLLRRIHDFRHAYVPSSPVLIAPFAPYPLLGLMILKKLPRLRQGVFIPMLLASGGIGWAYCVGILNAGVVPASIQCLQFASCMILYAYVCVNFERLDLKTLGKWILVLGALEAGYGIWQWVAPTPWDVAWFKATGFEKAAGAAVPFSIRTFGTLNATSHFSSFMFFVLVGFAESPGFLFAAPVVMAGLGTTLVRTLWVGTLAGWAVTLLVAPFRSKMKVSFSLAVLVGITLAAALPFADRLESLSKRLDTMKDMQKDGSMSDRKKLFSAALEGGALESVDGVGMGGTGAAARVTNSGLAGIDNGYIQLVWLFGWVGSILYVAGIVWGIGRSFATSTVFEPGRAPFLGVVASLFIVNVVESSFEDFKGIMFWLSLAILNAPKSGSTGSDAGKDSP